MDALPSGDLLVAAFFGVVFVWMGIWWIQWVAFIGSILGSGWRVLDEGLRLFSMWAMSG
jgi:hypothetical protein